MPAAHAGMMVTPSVRLVRPLGEGGMGSVWVAEHLALRTQVVVKFIAAELSGSKDAHERFSREAAAAAQVKSPHVVQTFDHGVMDDGLAYIVMELLEGSDLGYHLDESTPLSPNLTLEIVTQLSRALERAHERGIVHRDIKPGNIFVSDAGSGEVFVKLLDFGIAKGVSGPGLDSHTKTGSMMGSPYYMSPEQVLGSKDVDHRTDLWSVGIVAFECLTGHKPFEAETVGGLAIKIHSAPLPLVTAFTKELPPAVDAWFHKACARDVDARYRTAKEMADALAAALGGQIPRSVDVPRLSNSPSEVSASSPTIAVHATTDSGIARSAPVAAPDAAPLPKKRRVATIAVAVFALGAASAIGAVALRGGAPAPSGLVATGRDPAPTPPPKPAEPAGTDAPPVAPRDAPHAAGSASVVEPGAPARVELGAKRPLRGAPHAAHVASPTPSSSAATHAPSAPAPTPTTTSSSPTRGHDIF